MVKLWKGIAAPGNLILWKAMDSVCCPHQRLSVVVLSWMIVDGVVAIGDGNNIFGAVEV